MSDNEFYHRVRVPLPTYVDKVGAWRDLLDEMRTWCYINYGNQWEYDRHGFWFKTEADAHWFRLRWMNDWVV